MDDESEDEELNELLEEIQAEEEAYEDGVPRPRLRATYGKGRLMLLAHGDALAEAGPILTMLGQREADERPVIADLADSRNAADPYGRWELTVRVLSPDGLGAEAEGAILDWAANVGYGRVWLPDRVEQIDIRRPFHRLAQVECGNCGQVWRNSGRKFWQKVHRLRCFPPFCLLCGGDLPAWEVDRRAEPEVYGARDPS